MTKGWIKVHRSLLESDIWQKDEPYDSRSAWLDLLMSANHEDRDIVFDYEVVKISRGQFITSIRKLAKRWKWSAERTLKYLRILERLEMIHRDSNTKRTLITIVNYDKYQDVPNADENTNENANRTQTEHGSEHGSEPNKKIKNEKNEKNNIYAQSFEQFWKVYPRHKDKSRAYECYRARLNAGYSEEELLTACKNYAEECKKNGTEERYIKHGSTFLSVNEPFRDYLKGETDARMGTDVSRDEAEYERQVREQLKRIESGEFDNENLWE